MKKLNPVISRFLAVSALALALPLSALAQTASAPAVGDKDSRPPMQRHHGHHGHHHGKDGMRGGAPFMMMRGLDLSAAQQEQAKALFEAGRKSMQDKRDALHKARAALHQLAVSDKYSQERAAELAKDIAQKESEQILFMAEQHNKFVQILTPEQRSKLQERMSKRAVAG